MQKGKLRYRKFYNEGFKRKPPMYYTEVNDLSYTIAIPQPTLTERLDARTCELCGKVGPVVMRHVRKLNQLKGKTECDRLMLEKHRGRHWLSVKSVMPKYTAMLNKVMLSTESRMRGDMQVRFGGAGTENLLPKGSKAFCTEPTFRERGRYH